MSEANRKFTLGPCLGRGGFGEVYRATMRSPGGLETQVAVKVLRGDVDAAGDAVHRLRDEGRLLALLDHPVILKVHDLVLLDGRVALVTEYVDGADLDVCATPPDPIGPRAALQAITAVAGALDVAFAARGPDGNRLGLVHRDLKPSNVRVGRHGEPKLLDFGVARSQMADREARTDSDLVVGSLAYMAPERFVEREALAPSDVFALGCVAYEVISRERFHPKSSMREVSTISSDPHRFAAHLEQRLALLRSAPVPLVALLRELLAFEPDARPTVADLAVRGEAIADGLGGPTLRAWCRARVWPAPPRFEGALEGKVLTEGTIPLAERPSSAPRLVKNPVMTLDVESARAATPRDTPRSPTPTPTPTRLPTPVHRSATPPSMPSRPAHPSVGERPWTEEALVRPVRTGPLPREEEPPKRSWGRVLALVAAAVVALSVGAVAVVALLGALGMAFWAM